MNILSVNSISSTATKDIDMAKQQLISDSAGEQLCEISKKRKDAELPNRSMRDIANEAINLLYEKECKK